MKPQGRVLFAGWFAAASPAACSAWTLAPRSRSVWYASSLSLASTKESTTTTYQPVLDFSNAHCVDLIDRLDDAIMGGISTSTVMTMTTTDDDDERPGQQRCAKWFGICRTDGGGFCGFRTLPFQGPLPVDDSATGFYLRARLVSDREPERRVWKFSTRTKPDRGEVVYQAPFQLTTEWSYIQVPFADFQLVRGPRTVPNGPPINTTAGVYQLGLTMSQFAFGQETMTAVKDFRPGFFEVHMREIGFYKENTAVASTSEFKVETPRVLSKRQAATQRPMRLKVLLPVAKLFFSEQR
jgi:hypothetical protein